MLIRSNNVRIVGSDGEMEPEVDDNKIITEQDKALALELKAKANKAFSGGSNLFDHYSSRSSELCGARRSSG